MSTPNKIKHLPLEPSISSPLTGDHLLNLYKLQDQHINEFGAITSTKQHAAARGAGFLVISAAMGETPRACNIVKPSLTNPDNWSMFIFWDADYLLTAISDTTAPEVILKAALHYVAGTAAEAFLGLLHPSSALSDFYRSVVCTTLLDSKFGLPLNTFSVRLASLSMQILKENCIQFEALRSRLEEKESVTELEVSMLMESVSAVNLKQYLGRLQ